MIFVHASIDFYFVFLWSFRNIRWICLSANQKQTPTNTLANKFDAVKVYVFFLWLNMIPCCKLADLCHLLSRIYSGPTWWLMVWVWIFICHLATEKDRNFFSHALIFSQQFFFLRLLFDLCLEADKLENTLVTAFLCDTTHLHKLCIHKSISIIDRP